MRVRPPRVMVVGIPNVGKSSFLNVMAGKKTARTGPQPGVTRGKQWVRVEGKLDLLDTPGLLWPRISVPDQALKMAALGVLGAKAYTQEEVARYILRVMQRQAPAALESRYGMKDVTALSEDQMMQAVARFRGFPEQETRDFANTSRFIISEFRNGRIARLILDQPGD